MFRPHPFNLQHQELSLPLEEIREAQACRTAWIIPNGLRIVTSHGAERFVVEGRGEWVGAIRTAKGPPASSG